MKVKVIDIDCINHETPDFQCCDCDFINETFEAIDKNDGLSYPVKVFMPNKSGYCVFERWQLEIIED